MPELPDVETFRRYFEAASLFQQVTEVMIKETRILSEVTAQDLEIRLIGHQFESAQRRGKYLFTRLENQSWVVFHFGMTGSLQYFRDVEGEPAYTRFRIGFAQGNSLAYINVRKLGLITFTERLEDFIQMKNLGPDALEMSPEEFRKRLIDRRGSAKSILMDQSFLSGIGNIYSDEILFQAGIHPEQEVKQLDGKMISTLYNAMKEVLETAIEVRADTDRLPKTYIIPHRKKGGVCPKCGNTLIQERIGGRTGYYCPEHQRG
ncbi:MAG: hypothetical protein LUP99_00640 [Methanomicrobiales archaeon]|nr:hypothetical protein [Methanomicrobiales archaeon]